MAGVAMALFLAVGGVSAYCEPPDLNPIRTAKLVVLRGLARPPNSNDIDGYRIVADELWRAQAQHSRKKQMNTLVIKDLHEGVSDVRELNGKEMENIKGGAGPDIGGYDTL